MSVPAYNFFLTGYGKTYLHHWTLRIVYSVLLFEEKIKLLPIMIIIIIIIIIK